MTMGGAYLFAFSQLRISRIIETANADGVLDAVERRLIKFASHTAKVLAVGLSYTIGRMWYMMFNQLMTHNFDDEVNKSLTNMVLAAVAFSCFGLFLVLVAKRQIHAKLVDEAPDHAIQHLIEQEQTHHKQMLSRTGVVAVRHTVGRAVV
jgi:hypothetical protein